MNTGGALDLGGFNQTVTSLAGGGVVSTSANSPTTVTLTNQGSGSSTFSGRITDGFGTVALTQSGPGTLTLTGANTYSGGTTISGGTLQIRTGGTTGSILGDVTDNAALAFDRSDTVTFTGAVSGTGSLTQLGGGTLLLTNTNTYSGGTTISAGTLQIGAGGTSGSIVGDVTDNGTLAFNRSDHVTFGGVVSGTGSLTQQGPGTLTLTGANTYGGGTTISGGTLQIGSAGRPARSSATWPTTRRWRSTAPIR